MQDDGGIAVTDLPPPAEATVQRKHRPVTLWLLGAVSVPVGFILVVVMPINAAVLVVALLGLSAVRTLGRWRAFLFAVGLGLAIPTVIYFGLAIAEHQTPAQRACTDSGSAFQLNLVPSVPGEPTPVAAAEHEALTNAVPGFALPSTGWVVVSRTATGATLQSGRFQVPTVRDPDGTWMVDSGSTCS